ncbi:hypothetical protein ATANTOWER_002666 [Ataeniobius toweri]|uniref:Uncharacterized protein n=2 Tax=Goodeidae TaxID=28758 RepID=A0ABU7BWE0_9TELE|nr:hypothetical protein [Ataeniobius toweri]
MIQYNEKHHQAVSSPYLDVNVLTTPETSLCFNFGSINAPLCRLTLAFSSLSILVFPNCPETYSDYTLMMTTHQTRPDKSSFNTGKCLPLLQISSVFILFCHI